MGSYNIPQDELYGVITQHGLVGTWGLRLKDEAAFLSPSIYEIYGLPADHDLPLEDGLSFYHEEDQPKLQAAIGNAIASGEGWDIEVRIICAQKKLKWVRSMGTPLKENGEVVELRGVLLDITKQKKSEAAIEDLNMRSKLALASNQIGVWDWDVEKNDVIWDEQMYRIFGFTDANSSPTPDDIWLAGLHPDDKERIEKEVEKAQNHGSFRYQFRVFLPNKEIRYIHSDGVVIKEPDGKGARMVGVNWDVTEFVVAKNSAEKALSSVVGVLSKVLELRDLSVAGHQKKVCEIATTIAKRMDLSADQVECLSLASQIHDIGQIRVPAEIINKPARLSSAELLMVQEHPATGYELVKDIEFPWPVAEVIYQHHERLDGTGYPRGLRGGEICIEARILAVADVLEAMTNIRPYRPALPLARALEELKSGWATKYDATVVDTVLEMIKNESFMESLT